MKTIK